MENRRIVVFTPYYPPLINPRSIRVKNLISELINLEEFLLITNPMRLERENSDWIREHGIDLSPQFGNTTQKSFARRLLGQLIWPDLFVLNSLYQLFKYIIKYRKKQDILITVSNPVSCHLIGLFCKAIYNQFWIADIGDLFDSKKTNRSFIAKYYENIVLQKADRIIVNSKSIYEYYQSEYKINTNKLSIIYNGSMINFEGLQSRLIKPYKISYFGNSYLPIRPGIAELLILQEAISKLEESGFYFEVKLIGRQNENLINSIDCDRIQLLEFVDSSKLKIQYSNTSILFSLANINYKGLPSKLEEYCLSGLPIIYFYSSLDDPGLEYLEGYHPLFLFHLDRSKVDELIEFILKYHEAGIKHITKNLKPNSTSWRKLLEELNK